MARKFLNMIRANEWWEYKLAPMLVIAYIVIAGSSFTITDLLPLIGVNLIALIVGAIFVSLLNDATDIEQDIKAGKRNRMSGFTRPQRIFLVLLPFVIGIGLIAAFINLFSAPGLLYLSAFGAFALYSLPPFRLKEKGIVGIIADAMGSQVFPTLFLAVYFYQYTGQHIQPISFVCLIVWLLCFGIRGILWHQFTDKENDKLSGLKTIVQNMSERRIVSAGLIIVSVELIAIVAFLSLSNLGFVLIGLLMYLFYNYSVFKIMGVEQTMLMPRDVPYRIFMFEYYQVFLPVSMLLFCVIKNPVNIVVLIIHCCLFPSGILKVGRDTVIISYKALVGGRLKN